MGDGLLLVRFDAEDGEAVILGGVAEELTGPGLRSKRLRRLFETPATMAKGMSSVSMQRMMRSFRSRGLT